MAPATIDSIAVMTDCQPVKVSQLTTYDKKSSTRTGAKSLAQWYCPQDVRALELADRSVLWLSPLLCRVVQLTWMPFPKD